MIRIATFILALFLASAAPAWAKRIALVIGNSAYQHITPLKNPKNDAALMQRALQKAGFEVLLLQDLDQIAMKQALLEFGRKLKAGSDAGMLFYAGHGVEVDGVNYLVPVDADVRAKDEIDIQALRVDDFMAMMEAAGANLNIIVLDACRNNPFRTMRGGRGGLSPIRAPRGTYVAYSTAPGTVAADGDGDNSPFTQALAKNLTIEGLLLESVFKRTREDVLKATDDQQLPFDSSAITGDFYFVPKPEAPVVVAAPVVAEAPPPVPDPEKDVAMLVPAPKPAPQPVEAKADSKQPKANGPLGISTLQLGDIMQADWSNHLRGIKALEPVTYRPYRSGIQTLCGIRKRFDGIVPCVGEKTVLIDMAFQEELRKRAAKDGPLTEITFLAHAQASLVQAQLGYLDKMFALIKSEAPERTLSLYRDFQQQTICLTGFWMGHSSIPEVAAIGTDDALLRATMASVKAAENDLVKRVTGPRLTIEDEIKWLGIGTRATSIDDCNSFQPDGAPVADPQPKNSGSEQALAVTPEQVFDTEGTDKSTVATLQTFHQLWSELLREQGIGYRPLAYEFYAGGIVDLCGSREFRNGSFYCAQEAKLFIDRKFMDQVQARANDDGPLPGAFVLSRGVAMHVLETLGIWPKAMNALNGLSDGAKAEMMNKLWLQTDCFAAFAMARSAVPELNAMNGKSKDVMAQVAELSKLLRTEIASPDLPQRLEWVDKGLAADSLVGCDTFAD